MNLTRRAVLAGVGVGSLAACADEPTATTTSSTTSSTTRPTTRSETVTGAPTKRRIEYGDHPAQFGELHLPTGDPRGVVVVVHGGFWRAQYDLSLGTPLAADLAGRGWAAWNIEYRRVGTATVGAGAVGAGGGTPETFDDVAAAIDALAGVDLDLSTVVTLGHSAGGHLGTWAASRTRHERWSGDDAVEVTGVVSQAGVLDLRRALAEGVGGSAVADLLGAAAVAGVPAELDPQQQLPLDVPVWCVHGRGDDIVPITQSEGYVAAATAAGARAQLVAVEGDHFVVIDLASDAWRAVVEILDGLG